MPNDMTLGLDDAPFSDRRRADRLSREQKRTENPLSAPSFA
jgi:hypothetical protein